MSNLPVAYSEKSVSIIISQSESNYMKIDTEMNIFFNYSNMLLTSSVYLNTMFFYMRVVRDVTITEKSLMKC